MSGAGAAAGVVIAGAGQAGGRLALLLRDNGFEGPVTLVGEEAHPPYERPPLSKAVLLGEAGPLDAALAPQDAYGERGIDLRLAVRVQRIDRQAKTLALSNGESLAYDRLVIATGVRPRALSLPGADLQGVHVLRTAGDALALRERLRPGGALVAIGAGFIGLEVAASARRLGLSVTVLEQAPVCLGRVLPAFSAAPLLDLHRGEGVDIRCAVVAEAIEGTASASGVRLSTGGVVPADAVLIGVGSTPNIELAAEAGLPCGQGVLTDAEGRTADPDIFAIGDAAESPAPDGVGTLRLESWDNAERQASRAADALLGRAPPDAPEPPPWFWTDQYDWNIQMLGLPAPGDVPLLRPGGSPRQFIHLYLRNGTLVAAVLFNAGRDRRALARLIQDRAAPDPARLSDPAADLRSLSLASV